MVFQNYALYPHMNVLVVGIRPECLTIAPSTDEVEAARERTISVRAELVESLGNESLLHFSTDARMVRSRGNVWTAAPDAEPPGDIAAASSTEGAARVDPRVPLAVGDHLAPVVDVDRIHFFDAESGDAIRATDSSHVAPLRAGSTLGGRIHGQQ